MMRKTSSPQTKTIPCKYRRIAVTNAQLKIAVVSNPTGVYRVPIAIDLREVPASPLPAQFKHFWMLNTKPDHLIIKISNRLFRLTLDRHHGDKRADYGYNTSYDCRRKFHLHNTPPSLSLDRRSHHETQPVGRISDSVIRRNRTSANEISLHRLTKQSHHYETTATRRTSSPADYAGANPPYARASTSYLTSTITAPGHILLTTRSTPSRSPETPRST